MDKFHKTNDAIHKSLNDACEMYMFINRGDEASAVMMKGTVPDLLCMLHGLYKNLRNRISQEYGEACADELMRTIAMSEGEIEAETLKIKADIPKWLKRLMKLEEEDDSTFKVECKEEDEEDDDDEGFHPDLDRLFGRRIHNSDDVGE